MPFKDHAFILLAAGNSQRMGEDKLFLKTPDGRNIAERILEKVNSLHFGKILVVSSQRNLNEINRICIRLKCDNTKVILNSFPEKDRLYSLQLALKECRNLPAFFHNADDPELSDLTFSLLKEQIGKADVAIPQYNGKGGHPVLLSSKAVHQLNKADWRSRIDNELKSLNKVYVPVNDPGILLDIDTPEEYKEYLKEFSL